MAVPWRLLSPRAPIQNFSTVRHKPAHSRASHLRISQAYPRASFPHLASRTYAVAATSSSQKYGLDPPIYGYDSFHASHDEFHLISPNDTIIDPSSSKSLKPSPPKPSTRIRRSPTPVRDQNSAFSMRNVAETPWLQEEDGDVKSNFFEQFQPSQRFDWRGFALSRAKLRAPEGVSIKPARPRRYLPLVEVVKPGEEHYESIQSYRSKFRSLLRLEQSENEGEIQQRLKVWSIDRLVEAGYCIPDLVGFWLQNTHFGRPVASFYLGPGTVLPWNRFEVGHQVRISETDPADGIAASVIYKSPSQIRLAFEERFVVDEHPWRIDLWSSDIAFQRMMASIEAFNYDPSHHERDSLDSRELILQGTHLRDLLLRSFQPSVEDGHQSTDSAKLAQASIETSPSSLDDLKITRTANSQSGAFAENQLIQSWANRYSQSDPVVVEGDPVVELNESQIKAVATMIGQKLSLIQGPPGTGKTLTIAETIRLLKVHWEVPHPLLVCTYTNVAVDNLVEALVKRGVKPLRVGSAGATKESMAQYTLDGQLAVHPLKKDIDKLSKQLEKLSETLREKENLKWADPKSKAGARLERMKAKQGRLRKTVYAMEREALHDIITSADVICTTCLTSACSALQMVDFPVVFLDEASMCTEPASLVPIMKGSQHVALIGDHQQLPPIITSPEAQAGGLGVSLFERLANEERTPTVMLDCQYRMHPLISAFPSQEFYSKALQDGTISQTGVPLPSLAPPNSVHLIPHPEDEAQAVPSVVFLNHEGHESRKDKSRVNHAEAAIVCGVVEDLLLQNPTLRGVDIGIIAPYAAQITLVDRQLKADRAYQDRFISTLGRHRALETQSVEVKTVDGFEGREKDVIIFSTVRSNASGYIGFLADRRRLNVGLTRAKRGLFLVGNINTLKKAKIGFVEGAGLKVLGTGAGARSVKVDVGVDAGGAPLPIKPTAGPILDGTINAAIPMTLESAPLPADPPSDIPKAISKPKTSLSKNAAHVWRRYIEWLQERHMVLHMLNDRVSARSLLKA